MWMLWKKEIILTQDLPSRHMTLKWRGTDVDATCKSRNDVVQCLLFWRPKLLREQILFLRVGPIKMEAEKKLIRVCFPGFWNPSKMALTPFEKGGGGRRLNSENGKVPSPKSVHIHHSMFLFARVTSLLTCRQHLNMWSCLTVFRCWSIVSGTLSLFQSARRLPFFWFLSSTACLLRYIGE